MSKSCFSFDPDKLRGTPEEWRGAWPKGVDFSGDSNRVLAAHVGGGDDIKYGFNWLGPIDLTIDGNAVKLEKWATNILDIFGGYVHLLPADGHADLDKECLDDFD
jgi:hypothetical protein